MKLSRFSKTFGGNKVLNFPGMELKPGTIYAIIGANGSGKSTFARIVAGVLKADQKGTIHDVSSLGYMPQKSYAFRMNTRANILLNGGNREQAEKWMAALRIDHLSEKPAHKLSGGETARMALARLMMKRYDCIILDEPTASMDMESTVLAESLMQNYVQENGCTMILVTHSLQQAMRTADEVLYFQGGELIEWGDARCVLRHPADERTKRFLEFYGKV